MTAQISTLVDALNGTFGRHPGARASHAKGIGVVGTFTPATPSPVKGIELLSEAIPARLTGRFSIGGGNPNQSDTSRTVRGFALHIATARDSWTLAMISTPVFFARDAQQFVDFLAARKPDPALGGPNPQSVAAFNAANPNTLPYQAYLKETAPAACYTREHYHSAHAYGLGEAGFARLELRPLAGRLGLSSEEETTLDAKFLGPRLHQTLKEGPAQWDLIAHLAANSEDCADVTLPWHHAGPKLTLGRVTIEALDSNADNLDRVYDPSDLPAGISAPQDPIFPLRSPAYGISYTRRHSS